MDLFLRLILYCRRHCIGDPSILPSSRRQLGTARTGLLLGPLSAAAVISPLVGVANLLAETRAKMEGGRGEDRDRDQQPRVEGNLGHDMQKVK